MAILEIKELEPIMEKLISIEKLQIENGMPAYLPADIVAEKYGINKQTLASAAKEQIIRKYIFKRRIYYSPKEIDKAIYEGMVKPFNPKAIKK